LKFTPSGGTVTATLTRRGSKLYLSIQDSGSGIAEHLRRTAHSRFLREPSLEDSRFGIGLGMVLIRSTAALHGGTLLIDQPDSGGTRVTMSLQIRQSKNTILRDTNMLRIDYAGERDHGLLELSDVLPAELYH
jgi:K+-sensing histidine kinase KdpD